MAGDGVGVAFSGDGLQARDADRISLETIPELVRLAKGDHVAFVKKVVDAVAAGEKLPHGSLPTRHHCRLGRWYDGVSDPATRALGSFKALNEPHQAVHNSGIRALAALSADDMLAARREVAVLKAACLQVLQILDEFGRAYLHYPREPVRHDEGRLTSVHPVGADHPRRSNRINISA